MQRYLIRPYSTNYSNLFRRVFSSADKRAVINDKITVQTMRVVYQEEKTGKSEWKIMNKTEALDLAKEMKLDFVLSMYLFFLFVQ